MSKDSDAAWVQALFDDERVQKARFSLVQEIHNSWASSEDQIEREECWRLLQLERRFFKMLERYLRESAVSRSRNGSG